MVLPSWIGIFYSPCRNSAYEFLPWTSTKLDEEDSFSLVLCKLDQKQKTHSVICKEAKAVNRNSKKCFMRRRGECEDKILEKFLVGSVSTDFNEKMKHYKAGFSEYKRLLKEFPRRHNRLTENTTLKKKRVQISFG